MVLACRSPDKAAPVLAEISAQGQGGASFLALDLADLSQVRQAAAEFLKSGRPLQGLINNAGLAGQRGATRDGFELAFGVNHLGHYLLTRLLLPRVVESGPARIVNVSSKSHYQAKGIDWSVLQQPTRTVAGLDEYSVSKLANVLFTKALVRRLNPAQVTTYSLHPGVVATDIWRRIPGPFRWVAKKFMITPEEGAKTTLYCANEGGLTNGGYFDACKERRPNKIATDEALQEELWRRSAAWVGLPES